MVGGRADQASGWRPAKVGTGRQVRSMDPIALAIHKAYSLQMVCYFASQIAYDGHLTSAPRNGRLGTIPQSQLEHQGPISLSSLADNSTWQISFGYQLQHHKLYSIFGW